MSYLDCDRIYAQYRDKPKAVKWFNINKDIGNQFCDTFTSIATSYDVDQAEGDLLDILGRVVGVSRSYQSQILLQPSSFGDPNIEFGDDSSEFGFATATLSNQVNDIIYRMLIKAKIAKNNTNATIDDILIALSFIVPNSKSILIDHKDMSFSIEFNGALSPTQRFVLNTFDIVPRPQGVKFSGFTENPKVTQFGGAYSFGDTRAKFGYRFGA